MRELTRRVGRLQRLAVFDAAARFGSFTAAARDLGMTQPAVTRQVRALEASLGVPLFVRSPNRSELTDAGRRLHTELTAAFVDVERVLAEISTRRDTFVLACQPGLAHQWLMPRLDQLQRVLGGADLRLWLFDRDAELADGAFDAAIRFGSETFPGHESSLLLPERVVPVAAGGFAREHRLSARTAPRRLLGAPLLHIDDGDRPWLSWTEWFAGEGLTLPRQPGRVLFHNYPLVLQRAIAGHGIALGWLGLIDDLLDSGVLARVGPEVRTERGYYLSWPAGRTSAVLAALRTFLLGQVGSTSED